MDNVIISQRTSKMVLLSSYCVLSHNDDFMEIVEWVNGEGFDVEVYTNRETTKYSMTYGQLDALNKLANHGKED